MYVKTFWGKRTSLRGKKLSTSSLKILISKLHITQFCGRSQKMFMVRLRPGDNCPVVPPLVMPLRPAKYDAGRAN